MEILLSGLQGQQLGRSRTIDTWCLDLPLFLEHIPITVPSFPKSETNLWKALPARTRRCTLPSWESVYNTYLMLISRTWTWSLPLLSAVPSCVMEEDSGIQTPQPCSCFCGWPSPRTVNFTITNTSELAVAIFKYCLPLAIHSALHLQSSIKHRWWGLINLLFVKCQKKIFKMFFMCSSTLPK